MKPRAIHILAAAAVTAGVVAFLKPDLMKPLVDGVRKVASPQSASKAAPAVKPETPAPAVSVTRIAEAEFNETVMVSGSLVAREEVMVAPEVEGLRVLEVLVEQGDRVRKGQVMARLVSESLDAQLAQNSAGIARAEAAIAQSQSSIVQAEARLREAKNSFDRARPLKQSGYLSESTLDQREAAAKTAEAQLVAARDGLKLAEAEKAQAEAVRREMQWRRGNTEIKAPIDGVVSRRNARIGALATGAAEPLFRIVAKGEIELDAEVAEAQMARLKEGQRARINVAGLEEVTGQVRLVSPEIDQSTRLGRVRVLLGDKPGLRTGAFGRGIVETAQGRGLAAPVSALVYGVDGVTLQVVVKDRVETRRVTTGLAAEGLVEIKSGVAEGDMIVSRAGTFLRDGDRVKPVVADAAKLSEAK